MNGFEAEMIDSDELRRRDDTRDDVIGARALRHIITEPDRLLSALRTHVIEAGVTVRNTTVQGILADRDVPGVVTEDDEVFEGSVVLSAGIWSDGLARRHRIRVPMQPARATTSWSIPTIPPAWRASAANRWWRSMR